MCEFFHSKLNVIRTHHPQMSFLIGAMATFDVYGFSNLNKDQVSSADLAVLNEQRHDLTDGNALFAGWMVC